MLVYKAFRKGLVCRGYQFKEGLNVTEEANCVKNGFHAAENPIDCLTYYPDIRSSEYWLVDASGDIDEDARDSKVSCTHLNVLKRLSLRTYFLHCLMWLACHPKDRNHPTVRKDHGAALNGYVIVYGINPIGKGKKGDIIALLQLDNWNNAISMAVHVVGERDILADVYYDVFGNEVKYD